MTLRRPARRMMIALGVAVFVLIAGALLIEEGEVVNLTTRDAASHTLETQLWIVDLDGSEYLRAGRAEAHWLERIRSRPEVVLMRAGVGSERVAVPLEDPQLRARVNRAMREKYGASERFFWLLRDLEASVPIRLDSAPGTAASGGGPAEARP